MKSSPKHDLTERPVADQLDRQVTVFAISSLSQTSRHTKSIALRCVLLSCLIVAASLLGGCGSSKSELPTITPRELSTNAERLSIVTFSPDGKRLAAGSAGGEVLVWKDLSGSPEVLKSNRSSPLVGLMWSPDGLLAATDVDRGFSGWQFGESIPDRVELPELPSPAVCLAFRPNTKERELVLGMQDGSLIFVDKSGSKQLKPEHRGPVKQALYSSDGKWLITAGADGKLVWRDAASRQTAQVVKGSETDISRIVLSSDGQQLVSGDWNGRLKVWDMATRKSLREFTQPDAVSGLCWVRGELVSGSWDGFVRGWEIQSGRCVRSLPTGQPVHDLAAHADSSQVVTVRLDQSVQIWDWSAVPAQ